MTRLKRTTFKKCCSFFFSTGPASGRVLLHGRDGRGQLPPAAPQLGEDLLRQPARPLRAPAQGRGRRASAQDRRTDQADGHGGGEQTEGLLWMLTSLS